MTHSCHSWLSGDLDSPFTNISGLQVAIMGPLSHWPHFLQLASPFQPYWPSPCSSIKLAHSCLRAFAQAVPAAWKVFLSDIHVAHSPASTSVCSYITFSDTQTTFALLLPSFFRTYHLEHCRTCSPTLSVLVFPGSVSSFRAGFFSVLWCLAQYLAHNR